MHWQEELSCGSHVVYIYGCLIGSERDVFLSKAWEHCAWAMLSGEPSTGCQTFLAGGSGAASTMPSLPKPALRAASHLQAALSPRMTPSNMLSALSAQATGSEETSPPGWREERKPCSSCRWMPSSPTVMFRQDRYSQSAGMYRLCAELQLLGLKLLKLHYYPSLCHSSANAPNPLAVCWWKLIFLPLKIFPSASSYCVLTPFLANKRSPPFSCCNVSFVGEALLCCAASGASGLVCYPFQALRSAPCYFGNQGKESSPGIGRTTCFYVWLVSLEQGGTVLKGLPAPSGTWPRIWLAFAVVMRHFNCNALITVFIAIVFCIFHKSCKELLFISIFSFYCGKSQGNPSVCITERN